MIAWMHERAEREERSAERREKDTRRKGEENDITADIQKNMIT
jgi:hypothetical protein